MLLDVADCDENVSLIMMPVDGRVFFQIIPLAQKVISYRNKLNVSLFVFGLVTGY